jgi:hypothetical protein
MLNMLYLKIQVVVATLILVIGQYREKLIITMKIYLFFLKIRSLEQIQRLKFGLLIKENQIIETNLFIILNGERGI